MQKIQSLDYVRFLFLFYAESDMIRTAGTNVLAYFVFERIQHDWKNTPSGRNCRQLAGYATFHAERTNYLYRRRHRRVRHQRHRCQHLGIPSDTGLDTWFDTGGIGPVGIRGVELVTRDFLSHLER